MEATVSEITIVMPARKETCSICMDDNINADQMFSIDECHHRFCSSCVKRHIEVKLLERGSMICPHAGCRSELIFGSCVNLLTPILQDLWVQRIEEDSIPVTKRVYCPNPRCSVLMSETELSISNSSEEADFMRCCVRCGEPFCSNCKVPWHHNLSCGDYKSLHPNHTEDELMLRDLADNKRWRQCRKCQNMIELSQGCASVICRCGHKFCYRCGADYGRCPHGHNFYDLTTGRLLLGTGCFCLWFIVFVLVMVAVIVGIVLAIRHFVRLL